MGSMMASFAEGLALAKQVKHHPALCMATALCRASFEHAVFPAPFDIESGGHLCSIRMLYMCTMQSQLLCDKCEMLSCDSRGCHCQVGLSQEDLLEASGLGAIAAPMFAMKVCVEINSDSIKT